MTRPPITRWQWFKISWLFSSFCALIAYLIGSQYLPFINTQSLLGSTYLFTAFSGQLGTLALLATLPMSLFVTVLKLRHLNNFLLWLSACCILLILMLDTQVYALYRFHLSGFVWNMAFGEGGNQIISFSWYSWTLAIGGVLLLVALVAGALHLAQKWVLSNTWRFTSLAFVIFALLSFLAANLMHIWYDAHNNHEIRAMTRHLPLYTPATAVRFMQQQGWIDPHELAEQPTTLTTSDKGGQLIYPDAPLTTQNQSQPNVLFVAIDAWRADTFEAETTPNTFRLTQADTAQYFKQHFSGGNVTKGGIFSLFYAIPPTYWDAMTAAQRAPVFFTTLQDQGYQTGIYGSSPLINPSFHRNVFSSIEHLKTKTEGSRPFERDLKMIENFQAFLDSNKEQPFVGFLFFDAAHGYAPPDDYQPKFTPYWERVDHVELGPDFDPVPYKNRYRTALHFIDEQIQRLIDDLKQRKLYDNTIIVITSDHGEEFNETKHNYWGHGSNFTRHQTQVPLLILWPGKERKVMSYRTSHYDIVPTILKETFQVKEDMSTFSSGHSLFEEGGRDWLLVHSYFNYGVIMKDRIITTYPTGQFEVTDEENRATDRTIPSQVTLEVLKEVSRFYR